MIFIFTQLLTDPPIPYGRAFSLPRLIEEREIILASLGRSLGERGGIGGSSRDFSYVFMLLFLFETRLMYFEDL